MRERIDAAHRALYGLMSWFAPVLLTLLVTPLVLRALGAAHYGVYTLIVGIAGFAIGLAPTRVLVREIAAKAASGQLHLAATSLWTSAILAWGLGMTLALVLWWCAPGLAAGPLRIVEELQPLVVTCARIFALAIPLILLRQTLSAVPQGLHRFDLEGRLVMATGILLVVGNGLLALRGAAVDGFIWWSLLVTAGSSAVALWLALRLLPKISVPAGWFRLASLRPLVHLGSVSLAYQVIAQLLLLFERVYVLRSLGAAAVAFYSIPLMIAIYLQASFASLTQFFFPLAAEAESVGDRERLRGLYRRALQMLAAPIVLAVLLLCLARFQLLSLWLGQGTAASSAPVMVQLMLSFGLVALLTVPWHTADALGKPLWNAGLGFSWLVINAALLVWLVPAIGLAGAGWARLASMIAVPFYIARVEIWLFGAVQWRFWLSVGLRLALAALAAGGALSVLMEWFPLAWWSIALAFGVSAAVYVLVLVASRYLSTADRAWLAARLRTLRLGGAAA